jgi:beta-galactosidase
MVRVAEFSWWNFQPTADGPYEFAWLDDVLAVLAANSVRAIVGTPTASPPSWLYKADPTIALVDNTGRRVGSGSRQNMNHLHPRFVNETVSIVSAIAAHYANDARVAGFQIDNEIHGDPDFSDITRAAFREWLAVKYGSTGALNTAWGSTFWGLTYDGFEEVPLPMATTDFESPGEMLDWRRFIADVAAGYLELQAGLLRSSAPTKAIFHNCMGTYPLVDYSRFALSLDYVAFDNYPFSFWTASTVPRAPATPDFSAASESRVYGTALQLAFMRGARGQAPFYIMEEQIAGTGQVALYGSAFPELARIAAWQGVANGADGVQFFRWRTSRWGVEQHWEGI